MKTCKKSGLIESTFILSFDCDTELDIAVIPAVYGKLRDLGICPVFAVPGELLIQGAEVYSRLANDGAEFINHGFKKHTNVELPQRRYESFYFYDTLTDEEVRNDILFGDRTIREILKVIPTGFRTPHFGTFQTNRNLKFLHQTLRELGYTASSSTAPIFGFRKGPSFINESVNEFPVTGCPRWPLRILDSWGFGFNPKSKVNKSDYLKELDTIAFMLESKGPMFVNIYADPSQIYDWPEFFQAMGKLAKFSIPSFKVALDRLKV